MWHGWLILRNSVLELRREAELKLDVRHSTTEWLLKIAQNNYMLYCSAVY